MRVYISNKLKARSKALASQDDAKTFCDMLTSQTHAFSPWKNFPQLISCAKRGDIIRVTTQRPPNSTAIMFTGTLLADAAAIMSQRLNGDVQFSNTVKPETDGQTVLEFKVN